MTDHYTFTNKRESEDGQGDAEVDDEVTRVNFQTLITPGSQSLDKLGHLFIPASNASEEESKVQKESDVFVECEPTNEDLQGLDNLEDGSEEGGIDKVEYKEQALYKLSTLKPEHTGHQSCHSCKATPSRNTSHNPEEKEIQKLLKLLEWPEPPISIGFMSSTSPKTTEYSLLDPRTTYQVGEHVKVFIRARDHYGQPKTYGGDYFQGKLHSPHLKAGVTGSITDHRNGSYTATFLFPWPGVCQIFISLIHSSEAVAILRKKRDTRPDKVFYYGYFYHNGRWATVECNFQPPGRDVCTYRDSHSGEEWFCVRPEGFPCSAYLEHSNGGHREILTSAEGKFLPRNITNQVVSTLSDLIVQPQKDTTDDRDICRPGLSNPDPSGFYLQHKWHSRVCRNQNFPTPDNVTSCLKGKVVYMFGDSTLRQWWEYLVDFVPSLQRVDLHVSYAPGPLLATDAEHGYLVQWRAHQRPLSMKRTRVQELKYIANELDNMGGGDDGLVIVINCLAHFIFFPVNVYLKRMRFIRDAVARLLERSPQTLVIIKSGNTGFLSTHGSDWLSWQLDTLMREVFSGLPVTILDAWQMTSCHYMTKSIHPGKIIVQNMVDLMLSFICPT
ncbi:PREDICTED: NXPE family member 3-like [Nanorana parkeri]|uniref:NXPE family member 3-like n=1 Tax=Nanorana parkeri TaxID=125878 RepID=UPI0008544C9D|nr:PREDICTED: NXPE family member 3-like [Nanorana parkeri]